MKTQCVSTLLVVTALCMASVSANAMDGWGVEVPYDVDVYDKPGGEGTTQAGFLKAGSWVILYEERDDHWCDVGSKTDPVPGGRGWIWCGLGDDGKNYTLRRLTADEVNSPKPGQQ